MVFTEARERFVPVKSEALHTCRSDLCSATDRSYRPQQQKELLPFHTRIETPGFLVCVILVRDFVQIAPPSLLQGSRRDKDKGRFYISLVSPRSTRDRLNCREMGNRTP